MTIRAVDLQRLVNLFGEPLTLLAKDYPTAYNTDTGQISVTEQPIPFIGYVATYDLGEIDGTYIIRGDRKLILGSTDSNGQPINPEPGDEVEGQGGRVSIVSVSKIMSNGVVISHICQVRE